MPVFLLSQAEQVWKLGFRAVPGVPVTSAETTSFFSV